MAEAPRRDEIWLIDLGEPIGHEAAFRRPAMVVSDDPANGYGLVVVCPIGRSRRGYPTRVEIEAGGTAGLAETSFVQAEQVRTISTGRLVQRLGRADVAVAHEVDRVLRLLLRL